MNASIVNIVYKYLQLSNFSIDKKTLELQLITHPDFPSIKSISDTLDYFGVENIVAKVPKEALMQLPTSFICLCNNDQINLVERKESLIVLTDENRKIKKISYNQFDEIWEGVVVVAEENQTRISTKKLTLEGIGLILLASLSLIIVFINSSPPIMLYSLLCFIGLIVSYFIAEEALGIDNKIINKACNVISKEDGCKAVINDRNSYLFKSISLSDASIIFFSSIFLNLLLNNHHIPTLFLISFLSIPMVIYSLYYQGIILKKWCLLCVIISTVLILQFVTLYLAYAKNDFDLSFTLKFILLSLSMILGWKTIKKILLEKSRLSQAEYSYLKFKRNKELFDNMMFNNQTLKFNKLSAKSEISFGSKNPKLTISAVTNPLCGFCSESFHTYYKLLQEYEDVELKLIFSLNSNSIDDLGAKVVTTILDYYRNQNHLLSLNSLREWFEERDYEKWSKKHRLQFPLNNEIQEIIIEHQDWIEENKINYTPTTYINDFLFPKNYEIDDIFLFIDELLVDKRIVKIIY